MMNIGEPQCRQTKVGGTSTVATSLALRPILADTTPSNSRIFARFSRREGCEFPAYRSHFVFGVMAPPDFRRNGATAFPA